MTTIEIRYTTGGYFWTTAGFPVEVPASPLCRFPSLMDATRDAMTFYETQAMAGKTFSFVFKGAVENK